MKKGAEIMSIIITELTEHQRNEVIKSLSILNGIAICRNCNTLLQFEDDEIDTTRMTPHITCGSCNHSIQLHSKYRKRKGE